MSRVPLMEVSAVIPTRGDVDLSEVLDSLPRGWQKIIWDNSKRDDLAVYGRYAAIAEADHPVIYTQDDDIVLTPDAISELVTAWQVPSWANRDYIVANMPDRFRHDFYRDHCLVGFGAMFHRSLPADAFKQFCGHPGSGWPWPPMVTDHFYRTCDIVFTALTPRILVDVPYRDLPHAHADNRMWKQPGHVSERRDMLELALRVRDREAA